MLHRYTSTSSLSLTSPVLHSSTSPTPDLLSTHPFNHCKDPRQHGPSAEYQPPTGYEAEMIELNRTLLNLSNQVIDDQDDFEEIGVKPLSYSQSLVHSAYDSAGSIATPPGSDLEDEHLGKMLTLPLYAEVSGKPDAESVQKRARREMQSTRFPKSVRSNESGNRFESGVHSVFRIALENLFLMVTRNICLIKPMNPLECQSHRGNLLQCYRREEQDKA